MSRFALAAVAAYALASVAHAGLSTPRPADWKAHFIPLTDTRPVLSAFAPKDCALEIIELEYNSPLPKRGAVMLIPGLFHDAFIWDLLPERGISYARWLMNTQGLQTYLFLPRGEGNSCYPVRSKLDDIIIDDIPTALKWVSDREGGRVYVWGHSQGAITLQASLAGLTRCGIFNCFKPEVADERARWVRAAGFAAGNVTMSSSEKPNPHLKMSLVEILIGRPLSPAIDVIEADWLTQAISPTDKDTSSPIDGDDSVAYWDIWESVYHIPNISKDARQAWYSKSLDMSTMGILRQYARGISHGGIFASSGEKFADHLKNIRMPSATVTVEFDTLSEAEMTRRDTYERIGSPVKRFYYFEGQGHEDYPLNADIMQTHTEVWDWLKANEVTETPLPVL